MEKFALIDINKIRAWFFDKKIERLIKKAKRLNKITEHKYIVLYVFGKARIYKKADLKRLIRIRVFKKGITIQDLEKSAIFVTA